MMSRHAIPSVVIAGLPFPGDQRPRTHSINEFVPGREPASGESPAKTKTVTPPGTTEKLAYGVVSSFHLANMDLPSKYEATRSPSKVQAAPRPRKLPPMRGATPMICAKSPLSPSVIGARRGR